MRPCPNCGQNVASESDRFCPNCGFQLPPAAAPAGPDPQAAYQQAQPAQQPVYTYAPAPDPNAYSAPTYTAGRASGANLPAAPLPGNARQNRPSPGSSAWMNLVRSVVTSDLRTLLILAAVVVAIIFVVVIVFKIVSFFLSLWWLWLLIIAVAAYAGQRRRRRGRRLP